jgi:hypothetical protein
VLDAALIGIYTSQEINLVPSANQHPSVLTLARRAAGLSAGAKTKHRISENPLAPDQNRQPGLPKPALRRNA